jgi:hypothetical protein
MARSHYITIDINTIVAILPTMSGMGIARFSAWSGVFRTRVGAVLSLWCLLMLIGGATQTLCLEIDGGCPPSAEGQSEPCHEPGPDSGGNTNCGSCIDVLVSEDASARCSRPDHELRAPVATQQLVAASAVLTHLEHVGAATSTLLDSRSLLDPSHRTTVLRI